MSPLQTEAMLDHMWEVLGRTSCTKHDVHRMLTTLYRDLRSQQIAALGSRFDEVGFDRYFMDSLRGNGLPLALSERARGIAA